MAKAGPVLRLFPEGDFMLAFIIEDPVAKSLRFDYSRFCFRSRTPGHEVPQPELYWAPWLPHTAATMSAATEEPVRVLVHPNQFPRAVEEALRACLRSRQMNHKFHYDTPRQTLRWLRLHEALSPARTDPDCVRLYDAAFTECAATLAGAGEVEVLSLGCGGGQKDAQLLRQLTVALPKARLRYVPVDVSVGLALTAQAAAIEAGVPPADTAPFVIDLALASDWASALAPVSDRVSARVLCFFGMLPNFNSHTVVPQLAALLKPSDVLLVSANLAPGTDYAAGVERALPLYDNDFTRDWLWAVLEDLGMKRDDGEMRFSIVSSPEEQGLLRIESNVTFIQACSIEYGNEVFNYAGGEKFRLFYSYRHNPERLAALLAPHGLSVSMQWINGSGEEGVFLCTRSNPNSGSQRAVS
jgi:L-histidine Nalpha-methyltransferase